MARLLSGSTLRRGGSGEFIDLAGAQPQLPPSETTLTGFTIVTDSLLRTSYRSSLGFVEFTSSSMYSALPDGTIKVLATGTSFLSTNTMSGNLVVEGGIGVGGNMHIEEDIVVNGITVGAGWEGANNVVLRGTAVELPNEFNEGYNSVAIGHSALLGLDSSYKDIAIGRYALSEGTNLRNSIAIGDSALKKIGSVDYIIVLDIQDITLSTPVRITAADHGLTTGTEIRIFDVQGTVELNENQYWVNVISSSTFDLYLDNWINTPVNGTNLSPYIDGGQAGVPVLRNGNLSIGNSSGQQLINGEDNLFIGNSAGRDLTTGSLNLFIGHNVGDEFQGGNGNISIGGDNLVNGLDNQINIGSVFYYNGSGDLNLNANTEFGLGTLASSTELVGTISTLTNTLPLVITLPNHGLYSGDKVLIKDVVGTSELNGNRYWINRLTADTFSLYSDEQLTSPIDGTTLNVFIAPGTVEKYKIYGALTVRGGGGIERNLVVGESLHAGVSGTSSYFYGNLLPVGSINLGSPDSKFNSLYLEGSTIYLGTVTLKSPDSLSLSIESPRGFVRQTVGNITLNSELDSLSTSSGSLIVEGGVGIGKQLHVGQTIYAESPTNSENTGSGALVVDGGAGIGKDVWIGGDLYVEGEINAVVTGVSNSAIDLEGGERGSLVYQEAQNETAFLPISESGKVLLSNGDLPYWGDVPTASNADKIFVNSATTSLYYIGLTEQIGEYSQIDSHTSLTYNQLNETLSSPRLEITNTTSSSTSTTDQSLVVSGGIGVEQNSYFASGIYGRDGNPDEDNLLYTPRVVVSATPPVNPRVGDIWVSANAYLQYIKDGTNKFWIQIGTV